MLFEYKISTDKENLHEITDFVKEAITDSKIMSGICVVYAPYSTAGICICENNQKNVVKDLLFSISQSFPYRPEYKHADCNSTQHIKNVFFGVNQTIIIQDGRLLLGAWQGVFLAELGGPRTRRFYVKIIEG